MVQLLIEKSVEGVGGEVIEHFFPHVVPVDSPFEYTLRQCGRDVHGEAVEEG